MQGAVSTSQIQLYTSSDGKVTLEVTQDAQTLWLTQAQMAELLGTKRPAITKHLGNIFRTGELQEQVACSVLEQTTQHGALKGRSQTGKLRYYNLDAIISVGTGSFLFLWYLRLNQHLLARPVESLINDNTLVALALLVAESLPEQKTLMVRLIEHFVLLKQDL